MRIKGAQHSIAIDVDLDVIFSDVNNETLLAEINRRQISHDTSRYSKRDLIDAINSGDRVHCGIVIAAIFGDGE